MDSAAGRSTSVTVFSVSSIPVDQTLNDDGSRIKAWFSGVDWDPSPSTELASVFLPLGNVRPRSRGRRRHSTLIVAIVSVLISLVLLVLIFVPASVSFTPRGRPWTMSRLYGIRSDGSTVNPVARLRYG